MNGTRNSLFILSVDILVIIRWFVDALYTTHNDKKGHTGLIMTMESGVITSFSRKQRLMGEAQWKLS